MTGVSLIRGNIGAGRPFRRFRIGGVVVHLKNLINGFVVKRDTARYHVVQSRAERVEVGAPCQCLALNLLRAHVERRSFHFPVDERFLARLLCDSHIEKHGFIVGIKHDVCRLDIFVKHPVFVPDQLERARDLEDDGKRFRLRKNLAVIKLFFDGFAVDILHRDVIKPVDFPRFKGGHDIGILELGGIARLIDEPFRRIFLIRERLLENFDGDLPFHRDLIGKVDTPAPARCQQADDPEPVDPEPLRQNVGGIVEREFLSAIRTGDTIRIIRIAGKTVVASAANIFAHSAGTSRQRAGRRFSPEIKENLLWTEFLFPSDRSRPLARVLWQAL